MEIRYMLTEEHKKYLIKHINKYRPRYQSFGRNYNKHSLPEYITARAIHSDLALFKLEHNVNETPTWIIIHIPTGWVIAQGEYWIIRNVKDTYPKFQWICDEKTGVFTIINASFTWQINSKIRYERYIENGPQT